ncbi:MAG: GLPGLI family protein [Tannerella sp.]|jgi:GLPGLI family protein|nr:GLPGLI family protein [Tannerella sp.]
MKVLSLLITAYCFLFVTIPTLNAQIKTESINRDVKIDTLKKDILDSSKYRVYYSLEFVKDTLIQGEKSECITLLQIGSKYNRFIDYGTLRQDSVFDALVKSGRGFSDILAQSMSIGRTAKFKTVILKNYPSVMSYTVQNTVGSSKYNYVDRDIALNWKLEDEEKEIEGYKCMKATCEYRGRSYVAWYALQIALSEGPYVFSGLPGLIMEIYDLKQHFHFTIAGFTQIKDYDPIYLLTDKVAILDRDKVRKIISNSYADPSGALKNLGGTVRGISEESVAKLSPKAYNPIELE